MGACGTAGLRTERSSSFWRGHPRGPGVTFAIQRERTAEGFFVRLSGDLNARMAVAVVEAITSTPDLSVVIDLTELTSFDEEGLRSLDEASDRLARDGRIVTIVGAREEVMGAARSPEATPANEAVDRPRPGVRSARH